MRNQTGKEGKPLKYLLGALSRYKKESIAAPLFKLIEALLDLFVPLITAEIINNGIATGDEQYIVNRVLLLVLLAACGLLISVVAQYFAAKAAVGCAADLRHALFSKIQTLGFSEMDTIGPSTLITRMTSDVNQVQNGLNLALRLFLRSPFIVFGSMVMAFSIDRRSALVFAAVIPVLAAVVFGIMAWTRPLYKRLQGRLDRVLGITRENLSGVRVVRAFHREADETERFFAANGQLAAGQLHAGRISALLNPLTYVAVNLGIIVLLRTGAVAVDAGGLRAGDVVALINYMGSILVELVKLANIIVQSSKAVASAGRVAAVLETKPAMTFPEASAEQPDAASDAVAFQHVSFTYAGAGGESLSDVSFSIPAGQTVGVIGGTGSGKTSLVSLIPRFYDATEGRVLVFGRPVAAWQKDELRNVVATVMQKAQLFSGTIRTNLCFGAPDASDEALWEALETAQAADFVKAKPLGLDEPVEQGGRNLSGGQKQRLTIARALVTKPRILILDDSASALDLATDAALRKALHALPRETTVCIVSQRTASLRNADQILVLDDGRLVGRGTHESLLSCCETYREIYESQFGKDGARA